MNYYVYEYLREDLTPYYIGKGSGNRAWRKNRNYYPGDDNRVKIIKDNLKLPKQEERCQNLLNFKMLG